MDSSVCPGCESAEETIEHIFLHCPVSRRAWFASALRVRISDDVTSLGGFLQQLCSDTDAEVIGKFCTFLYAVWDARNR